MKESASEPSRVDLDWRQLVRVLGHELNNSLAAIQSLAATSREVATGEAHLLAALAGIERRAAGVARFLNAWIDAAHLPAPQRAPIEVGELLARAVALVVPQQPRLEPGPPATVLADAQQIEQVLLNLLRNAGEAAAETCGSVSLGWQLLPTQVEIWVEDEGRGLAPGARPFEPFRTTKPGGSGIGLWISRQIAEAHGGTLELGGREGGPGCRAVLCLPR